jgi:hypothetical protein
MPVRLAEHCFIGSKPPARVGRDDKEEASPCPNHEYRSCAERKGQTEKFCRLCLNQQEMAARWRNIRKAFITIRSSTRKALAPSPAVISTEIKHWKFSIVASLRPDSAPVLIGIESS